MKTPLVNLLFWFGIIRLFAQTNAESIIPTFAQYIGSNPVEKIYLHLDKPYYAAGEDMYFRAYLTDIHLKSENVPSRIIYIELSDEKKQLVKRTLLYSEQNEYAGQIELPDSLPSAHYQLRAYTNWMRNAGEDYFYHRDIYIGHSAIDKQSKELTFDYQVNFFPEGGRILYGLSNKVAFKALSNDGFGTDITGTLKDEAGIEILRFSSSHLGMGYFEFIPEKNKVYTATVESNGIYKEIPLPKSTEGSTLSLSQSSDSIYLTIKSTQFQPEQIVLTGQSRHTICYVLEGLRRGREQTISIPKEKFPTGIAQFTLFKEKQPVSERLIFIDRKDDLHISVIPDKEQYGDREKVMLQIKATDKTGTPVEGSFSLSVTDDKVVISSIENQNIKGTLLLESDLKGHIENPGWYFSKDEPERENALDILLCTQGWTRYTWSKSEATKQVPNYPVESEFRITGKVTNLIGKPVKNGEVILFSNANHPGVAKTDKTGRFGFYGFDCPDTTILVLQSRTKKNSKTFIGLKIDDYNNQAELIRTPYYKKYGKIFPFQSHYIEQATLQKKYVDNMWTIALPEINIIDKKTGVTKGINSFKYSGETINKTDPINIIIGSLPSPLQGITSFYTPPEGTHPIYIIDGMEIDNELWENVYANLPANTFESIEIIRGADASMFGARGVNGAYIIKTKMFDTNNTLPNSSLLVYHPEGYCVRKEFYIPPYNNPEIKQNPTPDLRTTIYWNPVIRTNKDGSCWVEFYTADNTRSYSYIIEGMDNKNIGFNR